MVYKPREQKQSSTLDIGGPKFWDTTIGNKSEYKPTTWVWPGSVAPMFGRDPDTDFKLQQIKKRYADFDEKNLGQGQRQARHDDNVDTAIGVAWALLAPEVRIERLIPYAEKLWTKFMTKFAWLLSKAKGDEWAIAKIAEKIERSPGFESWRINEAPAHAKWNERYASKPAYERKAIANRAERDAGDFVGSEEAGSYDPKAYADEMKWMADEDRINTATFQGQ